MTPNDLAIRTRAKGSKRGSLLCTLLLTVNRFGRSCWRRWPNGSTPSLKVERRLAIGVECSWAPRPGLLESRSNKFLSRFGGQCQLSRVRWRPLAASRDGPPLNEIIPCYAAARAVVKSAARFSAPSGQKPNAKGPQIINRKSKNKKTPTPVFVLPRALTCGEKMGCKTKRLRAVPGFR